MRLMRSWASGGGKEERREGRRTRGKGGWLICIRLVEVLIAWSLVRVRWVSGVGRVGGGGGKERRVELTFVSFPFVLHSFR